MPKAAPKPSSQPVTRKAAGSAPTKAKTEKNKVTASPAAPSPEKAGKGSKAAPGVKASKEAPRRPAKVELVVDRALKEQWEKVEAAVRASKQKGAAAFDDLWEAVGEVLEHDPPLYLAGGFATAKAFLAAYFEEPERTAYRNIRVAKYASPAEEARYGVAKLDLVLSYIEAKLGAPAKGRVPVDFARVKIPVQRDGKERRLGIEEATAQEIAAATRKLQRSAKKAPTFAPPLVKAITGALAKGPLRAVTVRLARGKLSFGGVDPGALPALAQALASLKLPEN